MTISFDLSAEDSRLTLGITRRFIALYGKIGPEIRFLDVVMDLRACHANGNPLKLQELLDAKDSDFMHDLCGIQRHINRSTGQLEDYFSPRYSA